MKSASGYAASHINFPKKENNGISQSLKDMKKNKTELQKIFLFQLTLIKSKPMRFTITKKTSANVVIGERSHPIRMHL